MKQLFPLVTIHSCTFVLFLIIPLKRSSLPDYKVTSIVITQRIGFHPRPPPNLTLPSEAAEIRVW